MNKPTIQDLEEIIGTKERTLFYLTWLKHDRNATEAYLELHPNVSRQSAQVSGSRMLSNIPVKVVAEAYGLNQDKYFSVLLNAMNSTKWNDFTGEREPDYKTIKPYHDKLGKIIGIETNEGTNVQVNVVVPILGEDDAE